MLALQLFSELLTGTEQDDFDLYGFTTAITGAQKVLYIRGVRRVSSTNLLADAHSSTQSEKDLDAKFNRVFMKLLEEDESDVR